MPVETVTFTDSFTRSNTAVGAAANTTAVGNNWIDRVGSTWHIVSQKAQCENGNFQFNDLERPSGEAVLDGGATCTLLRTGGTTAVNKIRLTAASDHGYWAWVQGTIYCTVGQSGTATAAAGSAAGTQFMQSARSFSDGTYVLKHYAIKTSSGNKTTVTVKVYDSAGTTLLDSYAYTDTTANMQVAGVQAAAPLGAGETVDDWSTFTIPSRDGLTRYVVFDGNSLTAGAGASQSKWQYPAQCLDFLGPDWTGVNVGVSGQTTTNMSSDATTDVDARYDASKDVNWIVAWEGTNELAGGTSATTAYNNFKSYCQARKAAHPSTKIAVLTVIDRSESGLVAGWSTAAASYNTSLRNASGEGWYDILIDPALDARFTPGGGGSGTTTWYSADKIHLNDHGQMQIAIMVSEALRDNVGASDTTAPTPTSPTINNLGTTLTVVHSESVTGVSAADYTLSDSHSLSSASGAGTTWTMAVSPAVLQSETVTLGYTGTAVEDAAGNAMATFSGQAVTNNSTVVLPPAAPSAPSRLYSVVLTWGTVTGATGYKVYRDAVQIGTPSSATYTDSVAAGSYSYTVTATNSGGESSASSATSVTASGTTGGSGAIAVAF
jgi:lysophospholipase L1-like esterase